jgi:anaerobic ribonucleoside-triphosphate reductase activating protein
MTSLLLSRLHFPVRNLGYGIRAGIWFQGCTIYCRGCISRDTWSFDEAHRRSIGDVLAWLDDLDSPLDGITISGGEPTDQPDALKALLDALADRDDTTDVLMYSGRSTEVLERDFPWLWTRVDVVISEPFDATQMTDCALRGSANQRVHLLTDLSRRRYPEERFEEMYSSQRQQMSINVDGRTIWMVGIPKSGDLAKVERALARRGIAAKSTTWLS